MAPVPPVPSYPAARVLVLTDRRMVAGAGHWLDDVVAASLGAGGVAVVLREKDLPTAERRALAARLRAVTSEAGAALVVAGDPGLAVAVGADGVHLAAPDPWPADDLLLALDRACRGRAVVGRSCHTLAEVEAAAGEPRVDYVTYSPVFATPSKPGYGPAVGLDGVAAARRVTGDARPAVVALGGVGPGRVAACIEAGAGGVAAMGEVMRAGDPGAVVRALVAEVAEATGAAVGGVHG
jgi:thiamine-phosphate pyrophosphorylase